MSKFFDYVLHIVNAKHIRHSFLSIKSSHRKIEINHQSIWFEDPNEKELSIFVYTGYGQDQSELHCVTRIPSTPSLIHWIHYKKQCIQ